MTKYILLTLVIVSLRLVSAQTDMYSLDILIGDTISKKDTKKYFLFETYKDIDFDYMLTNQVDTSFYLLAFNGDKLISNLQVNETDIATQKEHIKKLSAYYDYKKNDTCTAFVDSPLAPSVTSNV